jgi:hypothetical protein
MTGSQTAVKNRNVNKGLKPMETAEKRKISPDNRSANQTKFMVWWAAVTLGTGFCILLGWAWLLLFAFGIIYFNDSNREQQEFLMVLSASIGNIIGIFFLTFAQRWLIRRYWGGLLEFTDGWFLAFCLIFPIGLIVIRFMGVWLPHLIPIFDLSIIISPLWQTFVQWRWMRRYVQKTWLFLLIQSAGVGLACYWWLERNVYFAHPLPTFISYLITLLVTGFVVYYLFTHHHITEKIKQKPKSD